MQPVVALQASLVQVLPSLHAMAVPAQAPTAHVSFAVHALPSSHAAVVLTWLHKPVALTQLSVVHALLSLQLSAGPGTHAEPLHTSPTVQPLPSEHGCVFAVCVQPATASHASFVHGLPSSQLNQEPATQLPAWQASPTEHTLLSALHAAPVFWATMLHKPVAVAHVFVAQVVFAAGSHVTTVAALTLQL